MSRKRLRQDRFLQGVVSIGAAVLLFLPLRFFAFAAESASYKMDFGSIDVGSLYSSAPDFELQNGFSPIETNGNSDNYQVSTLNLFEVCGNGQVEQGEVCDGANFDGKTCTTYGFTSGSLICNACQQILTTACTTTGSSGGSSGSGGSGSGGSSGAGNTTPPSAAPLPTTPPQQQNPIPETTSPASVAEEQKPTQPVSSPEEPIAETSPLLSANIATPAPESIPVLDDTPPVHDPLPVYTDISEDSLGLVPGQSYTVTILDAQGNFVDEYTIRADHDGDLCRAGCSILSPGIYEMYFSSNGEVQRHFFFTAGDVPVIVNSEIIFTEMTKLMAFDDFHFAGLIFADDYRGKIVGQATPRAVIVGEFHSPESVTTQVVADNDGKFVIVIPKKLSIGLHSFTLTNGYSDATQPLTYYFLLLPYWLAWVLLVFLFLLTIAAFWFIHQRKKARY